MENENAYIGVGDASIMISVNDRAEKPTFPVQRQAYEISNEIEYWGTDNLEPQKLLKDIEPNVVLSGAIDWAVRALYSGGLVYGYEEDGEIVRQSIPVIERMLKVSNINRQLLYGLMGLKMLGNAFPEFVKTRDGNAIARVSYLDSSYCRWSKFDGSAGFKNCIVNANWDLSLGRYTDQYTIHVPAIQMDGIGFEAEWMAEQEGSKFILPFVNYPTLGRSYYSSPVWAALRKSGWLTYANQIPTFKTSYLKNAAHIKYAVHVPESWWKWKYPDWDSLSVEKRQENRKTEHKRFDSFLSGVENAGKMLLMTFRDDPAFQSQGYTKWQIQVIDSKVLDGILKDDVLETTQMIHSAVGVDPTLLGVSPGSKMGAGSGSDKKQAYNIFMGVSKADQDILMRPLEIAAEYSGFPNLKFAIRNMLIADLKDITPKDRKVKDNIAQ